MGAGEVHSPPSSDYRRILRQPHNYLVLLSTAALGATVLALGLCKITSEHRHRSAELRPWRSVEVIPLLPPLAHPGYGRRRVELAQGSGRKIAILFDNVHGFTAVSESPPCELVFGLNRHLPRSGADALAINRRALNEGKERHKEKSSGGITRFTLDSLDSGYL